MGESADASYVIDSLLPPGLVIEHVEIGAAEICAVARSRSAISSCPVCGRVIDASSQPLPAVSGRSAGTRPSRSDQSGGSTIPMWRVELPQGRSSPSGSPRRSCGRSRVGRHGWNASFIISVWRWAVVRGQSLARRLLLPVSKDTLLRVVRARSPDGAQRRRSSGSTTGHGSGGIATERSSAISNGAGSSRCCPIARLQRCEAWLSAHPEIRVVSRDRGGGYGEAAARALPDAHPGRRSLASDGECERGVPRRGAPVDALDPRRDRRADDDQSGAAHLCGTDCNMRAICAAEETNAAIMALHKRRGPIKEIVRRTGHSRQLVRHVCAAAKAPMSSVPGRARWSSLAVRLDAQWAAGCRNGADSGAVCRCRASGAPLRVVSEWSDTAATSGEGDRSTASESPVGENDRPTDDHGARSSEQGRYRHHRCHRGCACRRSSTRATLIERFQAMVRQKLVAELEPWIDQPPSACSRPLPVASSGTKPRSAPPSPSLGPTARPKARSPSSSWSNARCTAGPSSTCFAPGYSAPHEKTNWTCTEKNQSPYSTPNHNQLADLQETSGRIRTSPSLKKRPSGPKATINWMKTRPSAV